jgi:WD40 repeat protein
MAFRFSQIPEEAALPDLKPVATQRRRNFLGETKRHSRPLRLSSWSLVIARYVSAVFKRQPFCYTDIVLVDLIKRRVLDFLGHYSEGFRIAACGHETVYIIDALTGRLARRVKLTPSCNALAFSPKNKSLICVVGEKIRFVDADLGIVSDGPPGMSSTVLHAVTFNPSGELVVAGGVEGTLRVIDVESEKLTNVPWPGPAPYRPHVYSLAYSPSGRLLACGSASGQVAVVDAHNYRLMITVSWRSSVRCIAWSPEENQLALAGDSGVELFCTNTGKREGVPGIYRSCAPSPKATFCIILVSLSVSIWLQQIDASLFLLLMSCIIHIASRDRRAVVDWSRNGLAVGADGLWVIDNDKKRRAPICSEGVFALEWSPDGTKVCVSTATSLRILDAISGKVLRKYFLGMPVKMLMWNK